VGCVQIPQGSETKDSGKANIEDNHNIWQRLCGKLQFSIPPTKHETSFIMLKDARFKGCVNNGLDFAVCIGSK
jgi:hypothetical protein